MDFEIDQARFLAALTLANNVSNKRAAMPVLACVLLRAARDHLACSATDMMISLTERVPAEVSAPGTVAVNARHLQQVVKTLPSGSLRVRALDNHWLRINAGRSEFKVMGLPETDFPALPDPQRAAKGGKAVPFHPVAGHVLADLLAKTEFCASTDEARVNVCGVFFELEGSTATVASTDGHRLAQYTRLLEGAHALPVDKGILIPLKGIRDLRRVLDRAGGATVELALDQRTTGQCLYLRTADLDLAVRLNNVPFPPYRQVIPKIHHRETTVDRAELTAALHRAEVMAPERTASVRVDLSAQALVLHADDPDTGVARQEIEIDLEGPALSIGFNARYLLAALEVIETERVRLRLGNEMDPLVLEPVDGPDFRAVVMPLRV